MKLEPPYTELKALMAKILDWWSETGRSRERIGELIKRVGMRTFLRAVDLPALPQMVKAPRTNPYVFFWPEDIKKKEVK
jgi:sulfite reductase alpha subunit